ncbi:MAG: hypothetical protein HFE26_04660 [Clostridia bacterium]|nr:hypothetical protein [Clostridia bacterium]
MKIKFLGTAAYEGVPSLFCHCRVCELSRKLGGRNLRSRSQTLIDGELLIEFNADTVWHYQRYGFDWDKICGCLVTHSHCDHLYADDVEMAANGYSHGHVPIRFYASRSGYEKLKPVVDKTDGGAVAVLVEAGKRFSVGKYSVLPLWANHDPASDPVFFAIEKGDKRILYAHDTGAFPEKSWELLKGEGRFDFVSLDCTGCLALGGDWVDYHMSFGTNVKIAEHMKKEGLADENTVFVLNHFSHNGGQTYDEMRAAAEANGFVVSYDGLEMEF